MLVDHDAPTWREQAEQMVGGEGARLEGTRAAPGEEAGAFVEPAAKAALSSFFFVLRLGPTLVSSPSLAVVHLSTYILWCSMAVSVFLLWVYDRRLGASARSPSRGRPGRARLPRVRVRRAHLWRGRADHRAALEQGPARFLQNFSMRPAQERNNKTAEKM